MGKIFGIPDDEYEYEFMVVIPSNSGNFKWHSSHETQEAYEVAKEVNGIVVHNVRVCKKQLKEN